MTFRKMLFVCLGNSCSSPMAEAIMTNLMEKTSLYWEVDSAALRSWNIGRRPHKRCMRVLNEHGLRTDHFSRQLSLQDFLYFDYIVAMDVYVYKELLAWAKLNRCISAGSVHLLCWYGKHDKPFAIHGLSPTCKLRLFRNAYYKIKQCCKQFILKQQVTIIQYKLPSTEDDFIETLAQPTSEQSDSEPQLHEEHPPGSENSSPTNCSPRQSLCHKCGKKCVTKS